MIFIYMYLFGGGDPMEPLIPSRVPPPQHYRMHRAQALGNRTQTQK